MPPDHLLYPIQTPTSVQFSLYDHVIDKSRKHLVLGMRSKIEIYSLDSNGLQLQFSLPIWGRLAAFAAVQIFLNDVKSLVFTLENEDCYIIHYHKNQFCDVLKITLPRVSNIPEMTDFIASHSESGQIALYVCHCMITVLPLRKKARKRFNPRSKYTENRLFYETVNIEIKFGNVTSMEYTILNPNYPKLWPAPLTGFPCLAVVRSPPDERPIMSCYAIQGRTGTVACSNNWRTFPSMSLVPFVGSVHTCLLVSSKAIEHCWVDFNGTEDELFGNGSRKRRVGSDTPQISVNRRFSFVKDLLNMDSSFDLSSGKTLSEFSCYAVIDESRILAISDDGSLYLILLSLDGESIHEVDFEYMGSVVPATNLLHISGNLFFVSSHFGPSVLFRLDAENLQIDIIQEIDNIGPVLDISLTQDSAELSQELNIFCSSGGFRAGTIKKISRGGILNTISEAEVLSGIKDLWYAESSSAVVASFTDCTVVYYMDKIPSEDQIELGLDIATLSFYQVSSSFHIQITKDEISTFKDNAICKCIERGGQITCGSTSEKYVAVGTAHDEFLVYDHDLELVFEKKYDSEVLAITFYKDKVAVSTWNPEAWLFIVDLNTGMQQQILPPSLSETPFSVSSLHMTFMASVGKAFLFAGCVNGPIHVFCVDDLEIQLNPLKGGTRAPVFLSTGRSVLAISDKPSEIMLALRIAVVDMFDYPINTNYSMIAACIKVPHEDDMDDDVTLICATSENKLVYAHVDSRPRTFLKQKCAQELVLRVIVTLDNKYLVALLVNEMKDDKDASAFSSHMVLYNASTMEELYRLRFGRVRNYFTECIVNIHTGVDNNPRFCVGANIQDDPATGYIRVYEIRNECIQEVGSQICVDPVYELAYSLNVLSASIAGAIRFYEISDTGILTEFASSDDKVILTESIAVSLSALGHHVVVGDMMRGFFIVDVHNLGTKISNRCPLMENESLPVHNTWVSTLELMPDNKILIGDISGNLFIHHKDDNDGTRDMGIHVGDTINCIRRVPAKGVIFPGLLAVDPLYGLLRPVMPRAILGTVSGGIYVLLEIKDKELAQAISNVIDKIQSEMRPLASQADDDGDSDDGDDSLARYEAYRRPVNIMDGEILASYPKLTTEFMNEALRDMNLSKEKADFVREVLEKIKTIG